MRYPPPGRIALPRLRREWVRWVLYAYFGLRHRLRLHGVQNVPETGPLILAANHPSFYDPALVAMGLRRRVDFMTWDAFMRLPYIGAAATWLGAFPVSLERASRSSLHTAMELLRRGGCLGIFPEGERTYDGSLNPLYPGPARLAVRFGVPIVPVTIRGAFHCWSWRHPWPVGGPLSVVYHPPIVVERPPRGDARAMRAVERDVMERLERAIRSALDPRDHVPGAAPPWGGAANDAGGEND